MNKNFILREKKHETFNWIENTKLSLKKKEKAFTTTYQEFTSTNTKPCQQFSPKWPIVTHSQQKTRPYDRTHLHQTSSNWKVVSVHGSIELDRLIQTVGVTCQVVSLTRPWTCKSWHTKPVTQERRTQIGSWQIHSHNWST